MTFGTFRKSFAILTSCKPLHWTSPLCKRLWFSFGFGVCFAFEMEEDSISPVKEGGGNCATWVFTCDFCLASVWFSDGWGKLTWIANGSQCGQLACWVPLLK